MPVFAAKALGFAGVEDIIEPWAIDPIETKRLTDVQAEIRKVIRER